MSVYRHAVLRQKVHHTLSRLHHKVLVVGACWDIPNEDLKPAIRLAIAKKRRPWFEGLRSNAGEPVQLKSATSKV